MENTYLYSGFYDLAQLEGLALVLREREQRKVEEERAEKQRVVAAEAERQLALKKKPGTVLVLDLFDTYRMVLDTAAVKNALDTLHLHPGHVLVLDLPLGNPAIRAEPISIYTVTNKLPQDVR